MTEAPNMIWVSDITYVHVEDILCAIGVIIDLYARMKREELSHKYYYDLEVLRHDVADYIDFFNNMRPHQKLGMLTPSAAEAKFSG